MKNGGVELYLSRDIVQGEDVPFYLLWDNPEIQDFIFDFKGFDSIYEFYNLKPNTERSQNHIRVDSLKQNFYLGGVLKTLKSDIPFKKGELSVVCIKKDGSQIHLSESRTLFTTFVEIPQTDDIIKIRDIQKLFEINLKGSTTIYLDIESSQDSDIKIVLPKEIQTAFQKFYFSLIEGFKALKIKFPEYNDFLDFNLQLLEKPDTFSSEQQVMEKAGEILNNFHPNEEFKNSLGLTFYNAIHIESNMVNLVIKPVIEYFESQTAKNAFLNTPILFLKVPKGKSYFKGKIYYQDIIQKEKKLKSGEKILPVNNYRNHGGNFEFLIESERELLIPIKEGIHIRRIENDR